MIQQRSPAFWLAIVLVLSALSGASFAQQANPIIELDRVVAVVNDDVIVMSELQQRVRTVRAQLRAAGTQLPPDDVLRRQVLERLILDRLQVQLAQLNGIRIDDDTLNAALTNIAKQNNLSLGEFRDILERDGYDFLSFREEIRQQILIQQIRQREVEQRVVVSQRDIDNYLATRAKQGNPDQEFRLSHILIAVPEAASTEVIDKARARAERILARLRDGADFAELAVSESDGQQALEGGDLGWRKSVELPSLFADEVRSMKVGEVRGPFRSASGFHIIRLAEERGTGKHVVTQTHARHILMRTSEVLSDADAELRLRQLKERIENGDDFAELARTLSDDRASAINGGDLGWLNPGDVVPVFETVMQELAPGQVSEPFRSQFGWHIVQVLERREYDGSEAVARAQARDQLRARKMAEETENWLRQLRDEAYVEYRLDE